MERHNKAVSKLEGEAAGSKPRMASANPERGKEDTTGELSGVGNAAEISKTDAAASSGDGIHPLLIDHILEKIFKHIICPKTEDEGLAESVVKTVQNLRLVCKEWKDVATRLYLSNRSPMVSLGRTWEPREPTPLEKMQNFLDVMKASDKIPVQRFRIYANAFVDENQRLMEDFMRICGPDAVQLNLSWDSYHAMKFTQGSFLDLNLMRLKTLKVDCRHYRKSCEIAYLIEALFTAAETLHEFELKVTHPHRNLAQGLVKRFDERTFKRIPKSVKVLRLNLHESDLHLESLAECEFQLKELHFHGQCGTNSKAICKFFEKQATTLELLKIRESYDNLPPPPLSVSLPRLHELRHLITDGGTIKQFSFPDTFPKLTTLNIVSWKHKSTYDELLSSRKEGLSLTEIHLPYRFLEEPLVEKAAQLFPNISKLHISPPGVFSEDLQDVFVYFPNLEEFYLTFPSGLRYNADSIFSGVSERHCRRILKAGNLDKLNIGDVQHGPSLLDLTKLKKLVLLIPSHVPEVEVTLTDFSVHFLFLKMTSLSELETHPYQMSPKYVRRLRKILTLKLHDEILLEGSSDSDSDDSQNLSDDSD